MQIALLIVLCLVSVLNASDTWMLYDDSEIGIIRITCDPDDLAWMYENVNSDSEHYAQIDFHNAWIDESMDSVGFRLRGNTSRQAAKKSFKISFNTYLPGRQFYGVDKLNLNGEHNDPSIIRSKLSWDHYQSLGMTASRAAHTAVFINDDYYGLYVSVEHIDDEFLSNHMDHPQGNLWKCLWPADLDYRGPNPWDYHPWVDATRPYELKTNIDDYDYAPLARLIDIINNTPDTAFEDSLEPFLAVDDVLKYFAMNVLLGNWDDYWFLRNNYYLYHDNAEDRFRFIPYDYDNNLGIDWFGVDWASTNPYEFANIDNPPTPRPLATRLMNNSRYRDLYTHFLQHISENILDLDLWDDRLTELHDLMSPWAEVDVYRTLDYGFSMDDFDNSYSDDYDNQHVKTGIREFINLRMATLPAQLEYQGSAPSIYAVDWWPRVPGPQDTIYVEAAIFSSAGLDSVIIGYHPDELTVVLSYPMSPAPISGSQNVDELDRWVAVLPPLGDNGLGRFNIAAIGLDGLSNLHPRNNDLITVATANSGAVGLKLNEFLADNETVLADQDGEYDDWLELYNPSDEDLFLSGLFLTDDPANLTKWMFPFGGVVIGSGEYMLIWCDDDEEQAGLHTNFKLSADGEFIALVATDGFTILDSLHFGPQQADYSEGRFPDAAGEWLPLSWPTPGGSNAVPVSTSSSPSVGGLDLYQNYPNPFNGTTLIRYVIPGPAQVMIQVFDLQGREIWGETFQHATGGEYHLPWSVADIPHQQLSTGIYFARVSTPEYSQIIKLTLIQ